MTSDPAGMRTTLAALIVRVAKARPGEPLERLGIYIADLTEPLGMQLSRAIYVAGHGPDPDSYLRPTSTRSLPPRAPFIVASISADNLTQIVARAGGTFARAAQELRRKPPADHARVLMAAGETAEVFHFPGASHWPS